jgi:hypothetical protein
MFELRLPGLRRLPLPWKALLSLTVIVMGVGYLIALANLYLTYHLTDGEPGLTSSDLRRAFYGNRANTKLASKIDGGSMQPFLKKPGDKEKILSWIQDGATEEGYRAAVKPILEANCTRCHNPNGLQRFAPLTNYEEVMAVTQVDRGEPVQLWARVAHTHVQSIGLIFFVLGLVFCLTSLSDTIKTLVIIAPFVLLVIDFGARFLARFWPETIFIMMGSGAAIGLCFAAMILYPLYEMWLQKQDTKV